MKATIRRQLSTDEGVFGALMTDGGFACFTLELPWRNNVPGASCIPAREYRCEWHWSPKHQRSLYHVQDVEGRTAVEIHSFNLAGDVEKGFLTQAEGCISLGQSVEVFEVGSISSMTKPQKGIAHSAATLAAFEEHLKHEPFDLEIVWNDEKA